MLQLLHIRDFVIVDEAHISFDAGFSVLSGETGAGKSILVDALSLALGARAEQGFIREGAQRTEISATFAPTPAVQQWLDTHDFNNEDELILRRTIDRNNRSRAYINGTPTPLTQLRSLTALLVDIHGQHAHQSLLDPRTHAALLDEQGQQQHLAKKTAHAWQHWQGLLRKLQQAQTEQAQTQEQLEHLNWQLEQLDKLALAENEWQQLTEEHQRLAHAHTLLDELSEALRLLEGEGAMSDDSSYAQSLLHQANQHVQAGLAHDAQLENIVQSLTSAHIACTEAISDLNSYLSSIEVDPARLQDIDARMAQAFTLARRFHCEPNELPAKQQALLDEQAQLQARTDIKQLEKQCQAAEQDFMKQAQQLSQARQKTASWLGQAVTELMQELAMQGGVFEVQLRPCPAYAGGLEQVEFLVAGHPGVQPAALAKVASGGELARISLALSVIASKATRVPTLIFDEVDAGIGGAVAEVVGRLLAELGKRHQVLCVTHLAQVAARAAHHFEVSKALSAGATVSTIKTLDAAQRIDEIARMLGGIQITQTTKEHAREMLGSNQ